MTQYCVEINKINIRHIQEIISVDSTSNGSTCLTAIHVECKKVLDSITRVHL